jgi:predicted nucleic acid-binding protein
MPRQLPKHPIQRSARRSGTAPLAARESPAPYVSHVEAFVVDASVSAAWFLPDEATDYTRAALQATVTCAVWVPALWLPEMANLLLGAQRRRRITADKRAELAAAASALRLQVCREPVSLQTLDALAADHTLSAYDACYLELALRRRLPLATLDKALLTAMKRSGVPTVALPT